MRNSFDPFEGVPYGKCIDCKKELASKEDSTHHMSETIEGGSSHRVSVQNPDRESRVSSEVTHVIGGAIEEAIEDLWRLVDAGDVTEEEITEALRGHSGFDDVWEEAVRELSE